MKTILDIVTTAATLAIVSIGLAHFWIGMPNYSEKVSNSLDAACHDLGGHHTEYSEIDTPAITGKAWRRIVAECLFDDGRGEYRIVVEYNSKAKKFKVIKMKRLHDDGKPKIEM
ncbi:MAG: hypothetical protein DSY80_05390 [Desulfocapsa sp.]|nr:MAG: hypothetical protein DSY80_05390 [Desulfocapsa sp.]